ncbi:MAG: hypothetical protein JO100_16010 [Pseudonocardia sp.]|nr:hypothetical protein [Pseudonocardia sp.]
MFLGLGQPATDLAHRLPGCELRGERGALPAKQGPAFSQRSYRAGNLVTPLLRGQRVPTLLGLVGLGQLPIQRGKGQLGLMYPPLLEQRVSG